MDWLILIVAVPAIIVPVVLLYGFSGCGLDAAPYCAGDEECNIGEHCDDDTCYADAERPSQPVSLSARAEDDQHILLNWTNTEPAATGFKLERSVENGPWEEVTATTPSPVDPANTRDDSADLKEGVTYFYQVSACIGACIPGTSSLPSDTSAATVLPATPSDLQANVANANEIDLKWNNRSAAATEFSLVDQLSEIYRGTGTTYAHMNPGPGVHSYQVSAVVLNGYEDNVQQDVFSDPSAVVSAAIFTPAFTAPPGTPSTDQSGVEGFCIVQRLASSLLLQGGTTVSLTLRGSTTGSLTLDRITISRVAAAGDPYDSAADLVTVATAVTLAPNTPQAIAPFGYILDATQDLLIAFDVSSTPGQGNLRYGPLAGADSYASATHEAQVLDRATGYGPAIGNLYLIERIDVA